MTADRPVALVCPCGHGVPRYAPDGGWGVPEGARPLTQEYREDEDGVMVTVYPMIHGRAFTYELDASSP